ncbi:MAG TPA: hypothetical protein VIX90_14880 [Edaphobacter sp.]
MIAETVADFAERARQLEALARPTPEDAPFFNHCMGLAKSMGLTWEQGAGICGRVPQRNQK